MVIVALPHWFGGDVAAAPLAWSSPAISLLNLNILGKMGYGALAGIDGVAVLAGEFRGTDVAKTIRRSVWIAAPLISSMFIPGTASVLVFTRPNAIDLVSPIRQVLSRGAPHLAGPAALLLVVTFLAGASLALTIMTRLPRPVGTTCSRHGSPVSISRSSLQDACGIGGTCRGIDDCSCGYSKFLAPRAKRPFSFPPTLEESATCAPACSCSRSRWWRAGRVRL
jgi:hypothetical protein